MNGAAVTVTRPARLLATILTMLLGLCAMPFSSARAAGSGSTPTTPASAPAVSMVLKEVAVGSVVSLRISGFSAKVLTVQVCGNEGRRGSVDCNVGEATTVDVPSERAMFLTQLPMVRPPAPCPCIVQVSSERFDEVAVAAFTLLGHPVGNVEDAEKSSTPLQVLVIAESAGDGLMSTLRSSLAGSTWYDVTVIVKNASASAVPGAALGVAVGRDAEDQIQEVTFPELGDLAPQETWRQTVRVKMSSPVYGTFVWRATTTAFGLSTTATTTTKNQPTLLFVVGVIFGLVVLTLIVRLVVRVVRRLQRGRRSAGMTQLGVAP